ncbi:hypothetical protein BH20ACT5_BH20ACT5_00860 [soil metagenome]
MRLLGALECPRYAAPVIRGVAVRNPFGPAP